MENIKRIEHTETAAEEAVRMMFRRARNSSRICSTLPGSAALLRNRLRRGFRCRTSSI